MKRQIEILPPSTLFSIELVNHRIEALNELGFSAHMRSGARDELKDYWPYSYKAMKIRAEQLLRACRDEENDILLFARGGYGASDVLPLLPWDELAGLKPKTLVGFSDICALLVAFHQRLGWPAIHGPMAGSPLWGKNGASDVELLCQILKGEEVEVVLDVDSDYGAAVKPMRFSHQGPLIGGCLSVLCNLLQTPYFYPAPEGAVVFFEEVGENPGRVLRYFNQVVQSGWLDQAAAIVFGRLLLPGAELSSEERAKDPSGNLDEAQLLRELKERSPVDVFYTRDFGHVSPNMPLMLGQKAIIRDGKLIVKVEKQSSEYVAKKGNGLEARL